MLHDIEGDIVLGDTDSLAEVTRGYDKEGLDRGQFQAKGGFARLNKVTRGKENGRRISNKPIAGLPELPR